MTVPLSVNNASEEPMVNIGFGGLHRDRGRTTGLVTPQNKRADRCDPTKLPIRPTRTVSSSWFLYQSTQKLAATGALLKQQAGLLR